MRKKRRARRSRRLLKACGAVLLAVVLAAGLERTAREGVVLLLEQRFGRVELGRLGLRVYPRFGVSGKDLALHLKGQEDGPPFLSVETFIAEVDIDGLRETPRRIPRLWLEGLRIQVSPRRRPRPQTPAEEKREVLSGFVIDEITADGTLLSVYPKNEAKEPLQFDLHRLELKSVGPDSPMSFEAILDIPKPPGRVETKGSFGPWDLNDPSLTPVSGDYIFENADLSVFGGIAGMLSSRGEYEGRLGRIEARGTTDTPDFRLVAAGHPVPLETRFNAVVDGTSGDTLLEPVDARILDSAFQARGGIVQRPGVKGKRVLLDASATEARLEDFLRLAMGADPPLLTGRVGFETRVEIPPGKRSLVERLKLDGHFDVTSARFQDPAVQEKINALSRAGRGMPEEKTRKTALSNLGGSFVLRDGVMTFKKLSFVVLGARVLLNGTYGLVNEKIDLHGELLFDAKLSQTTTGLKSFFLKAVDPLFKRKDVGTVVPIKITGTPKKPSVGIEIGRVFTRKQVASPRSRD